MTAGGKALLHQPTVTVPVVSWVYWNGDDQGGGGFNWWPPNTPEEVLLREFNREADGWEPVGECPARVRLVFVPDVPSHLEGSELTDYLDAERLDDMETTLRAHRVALCGLGRRAG